MKASVGELNDLFDLLYNNLANDGSANIDDFEKSMLLTKAQTEVVYNHMQNGGNKYQQGAENSDKRMLELAPLLITNEFTLSTWNKYNLYERTYVFNTYNTDTFVKVLNETMTLVDKNNNSYYRQIVPISFGSFERYLSKPGSQPLRNQVWKIMFYDNIKQIDSTDSFFVFNASDNNNIIPNLLKDTNAPSTLYTRGYKKPTPIILEDLSDRGLYVDDQQQETEFELPMLKNEIVQRAVEIAKGTYASDENGNLQLQNQLNLGQRSE